MADAPCRTIIADDEPIARRGLRRALLAEDGVELVAMCRSGAEALAAIRAHRPDLALLDIAMPALSGVDVLRRLEPAEAARRDIRDGIRLHSRSTHSICTRWTTC